jgi:hypothetical protein
MKRKPLNLRPTGETEAERKARLQREWDLLRANETDPRRVAVPYSAGSMILPVHYDEDE